MHSRFLLIILGASSLGSASAGQEAPSPSGGMLQRRIVIIKGERYLVQQCYCRTAADAFSLWFGKGPGAGTGAAGRPFNTQICPDEGAGHSDPAAGQRIPEH